VINSSSLNFSTTGDDELAHFVGEDRHLDEFIILEAVADDRRLAAVGGSEHGEQLGLGPRFEAEAEGPAEIENLFNDVSLLVDLDRIHAHVVAGVVVFVDGFLRLRESRRRDGGECR